jgi:hypothetical protein
VTVVILADAPTLTTGFGVTSRRIADALHGVGWEVACFGLKARPGDCAGHTPYLIWAAERGFSGRLLHHDAPPPAAAQHGCL